MLENYLRERKAEKPIALMAHIVIGYPSMEASLELVEAMVEAGVDIIELQIPFSEPIADGPVILHANQLALEAGASVEQCLAFAEKVTQRFPIPFLFMSYYNILFKRGVRSFVETMKQLEIRGAIVPDLPPEEAQEYCQAMDANQLAPIFIFSPNTTEQRLKLIAERARGFVYCVARKGVTGSSTDFSRDLSRYLARCRAATQLPLAVGFGVKDKSDVQFLSDKADVAVVGTQTLRVLQQGGVAAVGEFFRGLGA